MTVANPTGQAPLFPSRFNDGPPRSCGDFRVFYEPDNGAGSAGGGGGNATGTSGNANGTGDTSGDTTDADTSSAKEKEGADGSATNAKTQEQGKKDGAENDAPDAEEKITLTKAEHEAALKKVADETTARIEKRNKKAQDEATAKALKEQGNFQALHEQSEAKVKDLEKEVEELTLKLAGKDRESLASEVAGKHKLPPNLAKRLQGNTREELEADAKELAKEMGVKAAPPTENGGTRPNKDGAQRQTAAGEKTHSFSKPTDVPW